MATMPTETTERVIFQYQKEDGGGVRIVASQGLILDDFALDTLEEIIAMKRRECAHRSLPKIEG